MKVEIQTCKKKVEAAETKFKMDAAKFEEKGINLRLNLSIETLI